MKKKKSNHGGKRVGAGRKLNSSKYNEKTKPVRLPISKIGIVMEWLSKLYERPDDADPS